MSLSEKSRAAFPDLAMGDPIEVSAPDERGIKHSIGGIIERITFLDHTVGVMIDLVCGSTIVMIEESKGKLSVAFKEPEDGKIAPN